MKRATTKRSKSLVPKGQHARMATASLLLEIGSEELPWHMIQPAMTQLEHAITNLLTEHRIAHGTIRTFGSPRRVAVLVYGVATTQASWKQEILGPPKAVAYNPQGGPTKAAEGFAKTHGVPISALEIRHTAKGEYVCAVKHQRGRRTPVILTDTLPTLIQGLSFPKTMRWNESGVRYPRPIRWIVAMLGNKPIPFAFAGLQSGNRTWGHRALVGKQSAYLRGIEVKRPEDYEPLLKKVGVVVDPGQRRSELERQIHRLAKKVKGKVYPGNYSELVDQSVFSVECPNVICGSFDSQYLQLPTEVLITSMKEHQGYFSVINAKAELLPRFLAPTNMKIPKMDVIRKGNERVLAARLADARYFYEEDCKTKLADRVNRLNGVVFHQKLGTLYQKTERMISLIGLLAEMTGCGTLKEAAQRAALLNKVDLLTGMVGEFPTLQGVMGREYAAHDGESPEVCQALGELYYPRTPDDEIPRSRLGQLLSLTDRLDTLAAFFYVGLLPSGSEDPFALRRQAFGVVRILVEADIRMNVIPALRHMVTLLEKQGVQPVSTEVVTSEGKKDEPLPSLVEFLADRLRYYGRTLHGFREDVMDAVLGGRPVGQFIITDLLARMLALQDITCQDDFDPLMVGFKRAHRLVEKEQWTSDLVNPDLLQHPSEKELLVRLEEAQGSMTAAMEEQNYPLALKTLIGLKTTIDDFFDGVLVNAPEPDIRANRLALLRRVDQLFLSIGDLSHIQVQGQ